jgi:DNA-directed RNA polymerase subunit RPC12/RpoP
MTLTQIKSTIKKSLVGKTLKCRRCEEEAMIYLNDGRYFVYCPHCGDRTFLKLYNTKSL